MSLTLSRDIIMHLGEHGGNATVSSFLKENPSTPEEKLMEAIRLLKTGKNIYVTEKNGQKVMHITKKGEKLLP